ncbi:alpha/beta-hydrolase [Tricholoma matsutake]|nr:alpha/beta-hydrolase [Tricholoma matsutake 945]
MDLVELPTGVSLEVELTESPLPTENRQGKLAVCLHPWSWLGGRMDDLVLLSLQDSLLAEGYRVLRYNSRGVGRSTGWASLTGFSEANDLEALVKWAIDKVGSVQSLVIAGYSYGSLVASLHPVLPTVKTSHILLSYPLGPRSWLTLFHSNTYTAKLKELIANVDSNVLIIYGDCDDFTSVGRYKAWREELEGEYAGHLQIVEVARGSHFWRGRAGREMALMIREWCLP